MSKAAQAAEGLNAIAPVEVTHNNKMVEIFMIYCQQETYSSLDHHQTRKVQIFWY
jgi:hypothetical protein